MTLLWCGRLQMRLCLKSFCFAMLLSGLSLQSFSDTVHFAGFNMSGCSALEPAGSAGKAEGASVFFSIKFLTGSDEIDPVSAPLLERIALAVKELVDQGLKIRITGHTSTEASENYNMELSKRRAKAVADYLSIRYSIPQEYLEAEGKGEAEPLVSPESTEEDRMINRRIEIEAIKSRPDSTPFKPVPLGDTTKPVVILKGDLEMTLEQNAIFTDPGATAKDEVDGELTVSAQGKVDTSKPGFYTITYTATDKAGNTGTAKRTVTVRPAAVKNLGKPVDGNELSVEELVGMLNGPRKQ